MKEIFTDLYKKVLGFFQTQEKTENASKDVACNRLKLVLMQDRTNLTPFLLEKMRGEMIQVLSKYVEMDQEALELNFEQEGEQMALMLSIPVLRAKEEDEIKAILDEEEAAKAKAETDSNCTCGCEAGEECNCEKEEESEETDEDLEESEEEEVCSCGCEDEEAEEVSESPDEIEETEEVETPAKKSKKK